MANDEKLLEYLKRVTADLHQTRLRLQEVVGRDAEPIAVIGMGCRYPGEAGSPDDLWRLVAEGRDAIGPAPTDRGWTTTQQGGFLTGAADFDADFFGISPREALRTDPQQRIMLEICWEALERAGINPHSVRGRQVGMFAGSGLQDYAHLVEPDATGTSAAVISGRVAYLLGLEGPALTVDTACSSSLVALHLAAQSLRQRECTLALAGGVMVMSTPSSFEAFGGMAPDGRCKAFSESADGTGWSEGAGVLVLERLSDAQRNGHPILALIRGSAVNQDGASNGLTAPNGLAQQRVIRQALANAQLRPAEIDVVEAHGTGTTLGDPIEAEALRAAYGRDRGRPLLVGSLKSNIGHAQAAAGVGGIIKMVQAMQYGLVPRTLHVSEPSGHVDWTGLRLVTEPTPWPRTGHPRRAGVSSFGISGTNAHVILEQAPPLEMDEEPEPEHWPAGTVVPWVVSGRTAEGRKAQAERLLTGIDDQMDIDLAYSLATSRASLDHRAVVLAANRDSAMSGLRAVAAGEGALQGAALPGLTAFLFTGQGAQRLGMGRELYATFPAFADAMDAVLAHLDVPDVMFGTDADLLDQTGNAQPALFAIEVALYRLMESWGIKPDYLAGHSIGEVAAAHVAGVLSLEDACALMSARGRLMQDLPPGGAVVVVRADEFEVEALLTDGVSIAAVNGPDSIVIAGDETEVLAIAGRFGSTKRLRVSHAFHSVLMDPMLDEFRRVAETLTYSVPTIPIVSTVTGDVADGMDTAEYWVRQARQTVRFADGLRCLAEHGVSRFLELGPDGVLTSMARQTLNDALLVPTMRRNQPEIHTLLTAISRLYVSGVDIDWPSFFLGSGGRRVDLPTTVFQRRRYWPATEQPIVDAVVSMADSDRIVLTGHLSVESQPWLADHVIGGEVLFPGAGFAELAMRAGGAGLAELTLRKPLVVAGRVEIQVIVDGPKVTIHSRQNGEPWVMHAEGTLGPASPMAMELAWPPQGERLEPGELYADLSYGPKFRGVQALWRDGDEIFAEVALPSDGKYGIHPALFDACLHGARLLFDRPMMPFAWSGVDLHSSGASRLRVRLRSAGPNAITLIATDDTGRPVLSVDSLVLRPAGEAKPVEVHHEDLFEVVWTPVEVSPGRVSTMEWDDLYGPMDLGPVPDIVFIRPDNADVHLATRKMLAAMQCWLQDERFAPSRLLVLTSGAMALPGEDVTDLAGAAIWGMVRTAQIETPDRFLIADIDDTGDIAAIVASNEPQSIVRAGTVYGGRLARTHAPAQSVNFHGTVLVTGASGKLGRLICEHLVNHYGVRKLVLASREGQEAPDLDADITVVTCDVADRDEVATLLAEYPVNGVVHLAGVLDDGTIASMTPERMSEVLRPKVDAVINLHDLTENLSAFVLFSSVSGVLGSPGQINYAAANAFMDGFATHRRANDQAAQSLAWGLWSGGMAGRADLDRIRQTGIGTLSDAEGLALFDAAIRRDVPVVVPMRWDRRPMGDADETPLLFRRLGRGRWRSAQAPSPPDALADRLARLGQPDREAAVLDLVRTHVALTLGHPATVDLDRTFADLGFDSLSVVEFRDALAAELGVPLPATLAFDFPTPNMLARHLCRGGFQPVPEPRDSSGDEIAIVAMACRYPGGVSSPDDLWRMAQFGTDAIGEFPDNRGWDVDHLDTATREGGFLYEAGEFDPGFFGISPNEAATMDPQQYLLLETAWEAFERAGIDPAALNGSRTGFFAGMMYHDYPANSSTGALASGRVSYVFGLEGPSITVDTACSSSLVALHLAVQALRSGECSLALAGGVAVMATPETFVEFTRQGGLSADGRCKAFAEGADGTGWAEGVGMLLVERLADARRNGHPVLAIVKGTATNQDGTSNGLTAPNGPAQQRVILQALANAGLSPSDVDVVEGHGTGTVLGDPIEAQAVIAAYGRDRAEPLWLGSVKSNMGHTQAASGVAGIIKMVEAMRHGVMPKTLHVDEPTSHAEWGNVRLLTEAREWTGPIRRAGVSSFGISGTNAHVIIEHVPAPDLPEPDEPAMVPWVLSARTPQALQEQAERLVSHVDGLNTVDVGFSLATRVTFEHRAVIIGEPDQLMAGLAALATGQGPGFLRGSGRTKGTTAFLFTGGASDAGQELCEAYPVFAQAIGDGLEVALYRLLESWGVTPDFVAGPRAEDIAHGIPVVDGGLAEAIGELTAQGVIRFVEIGADSTGLVQRVAPEAIVIPLLRPGKPEVASLMMAMGQLYVTGGTVGWTKLLPGGRRVDLPTYAFQRQRFWSAARRFEPMSTVELASGGVVLTGGVSKEMQPWLADHEVMGTVLMPGTGFVELALRAGAQVGCTTIEELTLLTPLVVDCEVQMQVTVTGTHEVQIHAQREHEPWTLHAQGRLTKRTGTLPDLSQWPPPGATVMDLGSPYDRLLDKGFAYGRAFRGLRSAWRRGDELYAEVALPMQGEYVIHPALLDAAMHVAMLDGSGTLLPFAWTNVTLHGPASPMVRVRITRPAAESISLEIADGSGRPVLSAESIVGRPALGTESMYKIEWSAIPLPATPETIDVLECVTPEADVPTAVRMVLDQVLSALQGAQGRLAVVTRAGDLCQAAVWGLVRAAQAENPGQFFLVEIDGAKSGRLTLRAVASGEPELSIRDGELYIPRLTKVAVPRNPLTLRGTVLITGGTSGVGAHIARQLARQGIRLVLASRRGTDAPDAAELAALGAVVEACDVSDRDSIAALLAKHQISAVIHAAGTFDNSMIGSLTPDRMDTVLKPKVDGAWHLHELAKDLDALVLISSVGGLVLPGGQGNYAAANVFLDALAAYRAAQGLPATSVSFGQWDGVGRQRPARQGMPALSVDDSLTLFETAISAGETHLVPMRLGRLSGDVPALLRGMTSAAPVQSDALELVREFAAAILGHPGPAAIEPDRPFQELGFDSLAAVELRNQLSAATGRQLPATLAFDHPTARAVADLLTGPSAEPEPLAVQASDDPIVVIGMSCRYPGGVTSPDLLWELVANGVDAISEFPADRGWDERVYDPQPGKPGRTYTRQGGFLYDAADFDAGMFGISPADALTMDPQQRLLLETSWEALESAGIDPATLKGSPTGVFAGLMYHDYGLGVQSAMTAGGSLASGRTSYAFGLEGPAVTVDTACSSSLVALHLAAQALRSGECSLALAGGVAVMGTPGMFIEFSRQHGLAADGRSKPFSADADGTSWAEGAGVLLLERLSDAERHGHPVLAILRSTAINQDGASNGMTAPNGPAQQRVIRQALANAGLSPSDIDVVEAHGTGTTLGDPIEAQAVLATYGQDRDEPLWLGSVKSNIGHTQAASGVAGVIKMIQAIRHGILPKTLHSTQPTDKVDWGSGNVRLLAEAQEWVENGHPRRAGISSFGISGTNAHVIIEQASGPATRAKPSMTSAIPWVLSGKTPAALAAQAAKLLSHVEEDPELNPVDIAFSLATGRAVLPHRATVVGANRTKLMRALTALADGQTLQGVVQGNGKLDGSTAFLFTGQGAQRLGMGQELHATYPVFAQAFDEVVAELDKSLDMPLCGVIWGEDEELVNQTVFTQAGLFAVEVALFRLLESWGVKPDYLAGHSVGEITAAYLAGVFSLADAATLVAARGWLMQELPAGGAMAVIQAREDEVAPMMTGKVTIAAVNGPTSVVISGAEHIVVEVAARFAAQGRRADRLRVSHAFHSAQMDPMLADFRAVLDGLAYQLPRIPVVSSVTGEFADWLDTPDYWVRHARETVRFGDSVKFLQRKGVTRFVELGPDGVLTGMAEQSVPDAVLVPVIRRNRPETNGVVTALAQLHVSGVDVDWRSFFAGSNAQWVDLPTYAFQRSRYWIEPAVMTGDVSAVGQIPDDHPLLGAAVPSPDSDSMIFTGRLSTSDQPWLAEHQVQGSTLLPGSAFVDLVLHAGAQVGCGMVEELTLLEPLTTLDVSIQVVVGAPDDAGRRTVRVYAYKDTWIRHAEGVLTSATALPDFSLTDWPPPGAIPQDIALYETLAEFGFAYGRAFQGVQAVWRRGDDLFAEVTLPVPGDRFVLHPALLDAAMHPLALEASTHALVPFSWHGVSVHRAAASAVRVRLRPVEGGMSIVIADLAGVAVASVDTLVRRPAGQDSLLRVEWSEAPLAEAAELPDVLMLDSPAGEVPGAVRWVLDQVLAAVQWALVDERAPKLVVVTKNAMATVDGEDVDVRQAPVWGVMRAAQAENPGRFVLVDIDDDETSHENLAAAVATGEPELALRRGKMFIPRLTRMPAGGPQWSGDGMVLVTGGTSGLGALIARHLHTEYGVRNLLLVSRSGMEAPQAAELRAELGAAIEACDVSDRQAVADLLARYPITGIVHAAGTADSGIVSSLSSERMHTVLQPKADGAWYLHELAGDLDLFVMISSAGGHVLAAGQGNYAAANTFLDALAAHRKARGLPAVSMAFGLWDVETGLGREVDKSRLDREGLPPLSVEDGLKLFDAALSTDVAQVVPLRVDLNARGDRVPLLRGMRRKSATHRPRLDALPEEERSQAVLSLIRAQAAEVLGYDEAVDTSAEFAGLGFDSLTALELRNRVNDATGLTLPSMAVFDARTPAGLAEKVCQELGKSTKDTLYELFLASITDGNLHKGLSLLKAVAALRPEFHSPDDLTELPEPVTFATPEENPRRPRLICLSTPTAAGGVHQHARLAAKMHMPVTALPMPGFSPGESLPDSFDAAVAVLAESVRRAANGEPFVLLGFSSGGLLAHATAAQLEQMGINPMAVILLDTYRLTDDGSDEAGSGVVQQMAFAVPTKAAELGAFSSTQLSAMGRYVELLPSFTMRDVAAPVLFVQAGELFENGGQVAANWRATWDSAHTVLTVPGTHFTIAEQNAGTTARAIEGWLDTVIVDEYLGGTP